MAISKSKINFCWHITAYEENTLFATWFQAFPENNNGPNKQHRPLFSDDYVCYALKCLLNAPS